MRMEEIILFGLLPEWPRMNEGSAYVQYSHLWKNNLY